MDIHVRSVMQSDLIRHACFPKCSEMFKSFSYTIARAWSICSSKPNQNTDGCVLSEVKKYNIPGATLTHLMTCLQRIYAMNDRAYVRTKSMLKAGRHQIT